MMEIFFKFLALLLCEGLNLEQENITTWVGKFKILIFISCSGFYRSNQKRAGNLKKNSVNFYPVFLNTLINT